MPAVEVEATTLAEVQISLDRQRGLDDRATLTLAHEKTRVAALAAEVT